MPPPAAGDAGTWHQAAEAALRAKAFGPYKGEAITTPSPDSLMFGGAPSWLQHDQTPRGPDGRAMEFVGQVDASRFSKAIGGMFYLFHAPEAKLVTMISQIT